MVIIKTQSVLLKVILSRKPMVIIKNTKCTPGSNIK